MRAENTRANIGPDMRWTLVAILIGLPAYAHADAWRRALDGTDPKAAGSTAPPSSQEANDLIAWAGEPKLVTLGDLLKLTVQQSPALASAKLDIAIAEAQIAETWARHDWRLGAQATFSKSGSAVFSGIELQGSTTATGEVDIGRTLPTGGVIDFKLDTTYQSYDASSIIPASTYWTNDISGSITQPLLKGFGTKLYDAQERRAEFTRDAAVLARRYAALTAVQSVVSSYWDLVLAEQQVAITEQSLALARERLRVTEIQVKGGKVADAEIPAVQQIIATREEDVLNGELGVLNASLALRRTVGMPIGSGELGLRVAQELEQQEKPTDLASLVDRAFQASPQLAQLDKQNQAATIDIDVNDNNLLPQLDLALQAGPRGTDGTFHDAAADAIEFKTYQVNASLTFSRTLHQYDVKYRSKELRANREKLRVNASDLRLQLAQMMTQAVSQIELAKRRVVLSQRAIDLAKENIRIETDRFNLGRSTNFDVLNRLEEQRQAELRKAQALVDWHKAETVVMSLTGDLLPAYGITVE